MADPPGFDIQYEGPFFTANPAQTFGRNVINLMERAAWVGEDEVRRRIAGAPRVRYGPSRSARYVLGRTHSLKGKPWAAMAVISAYGGLTEANADGATFRSVNATLAGRHQAEAEPLLRGPADRCARSQRARASLTEA